MAQLHSRRQSSNQTKPKSYRKSRSMSSPCSTSPGSSSASGSKLTISSNNLKNPKKSQKRSSVSMPKITNRRYFLSASMLNHEKHTVYELSDYDYEDTYYSSSHSSRPLSFKISLMESQGFSWNQDLFASESLQERRNSRVTDRPQAIYDDDEAIVDMNHQAVEEIVINEKDFGTSENGSDDMPLFDNSSFKIVHKKRRPSANNERDGYSCMEISEIFVNETD